MNSFAKMGLLGSLQKTLKAQNMLKPTEIQYRSIPILLEGRSVVGVAETGGGKTLSYALPVLHLLKTMEDNGDPVSRESRPRAVVIVPTRELGEQVAKVFKMFTHDTRLRVRSVLGGTTMEIARRNIKGTFEVLVATPGRLVQLLDKKIISLEDVQFLVFDEVDQMLDQGFVKDVNRLVKECPEHRQMALFSATVSKPVQELIATLFEDAEMIESDGSHKTVSTLTTDNQKIKNGKRFPVLAKILNTPVEGGTLIFTNTREQCDKLAAELKEAGWECSIYRGEMDKVERRANLKTFREAKEGILISTDLASRGLDVEHVNRVINYHLPHQLENYIHRVGRTARAGRGGLVINLVTERDAPLMQEVTKISSKKSSKSQKSKEK